MDAKAYLGQVKKTDTLIRNKLIEKQQWKDIALCITSNIGSERVQSSGSKTKTADAVERYIALESDIDNAIDKLVDTKKEVIEVIEKLESPSQYDVTHRVYIQFQTFQEIADIYGKSYDWVKQTHKRAIRNIQVILDKQ